VTRIDLKIAIRPALLAAAAYLLFIAAAEPHRVHHSFDRHAKPSCPVYALAKGCHAQAAAAPAAEQSLTFIEIVVPIPNLWAPVAFAAPATQRAPPIV
jgi:hypothetical protein